MSDRSVCQGLFSYVGYPDFFLWSFCPTKADLVGAYVRRAFVKVFCPGGFYPVAYVRSPSGGLG